MKKLFAGEKAPFDGTLIDDEGLRQIDIELMQKDLCERKLSEVTCSESSLSSSTSILYFAAGLLAGGLVVNALAD